MKSEIRTWRAWRCFQDEKAWSWVTTASSRLRVYLKRNHHPHPCRKFSEVSAFIDHVVDLKSEADFWAFPPVHPHHSHPNPHFSFSRSLSPTQKLRCLRLCVCVCVRVSPPKKWRWDLWGMPSISLTCQKRPTVYQKRPTKYQKRPTIHMTKETYYKSKETYYTYDKKRPTVHQNTY
jgi:hypothetical protein